MNDSFLSVRDVSGQFETRGQSYCSLGHRLDLGAGRQPDGVYANWAWDGTTLTASNDRYGFFPVFYYSRDGAFAISPSIPRLLDAGADSTLDEAALAVFFRLGFFVGEDTPFRHIKALPPGATLVWDGTLRLRSAGCVAGSAHGSIARAAALDAYIALFRQAIARRPPPEPNFALPLSGGRDSRHILFELLHQGHRPGRCVTAQHFPPRDNEDARVAALLAREFGLHHDVLPQEESYFDAESRKNPLTNFCSDEHAWYLRTAADLRGRERVVYDGIGGDVLSAGLFLNESRLRLFQSGSPGAIAQHLLGQDEMKLSCLLTPDLHRRASLECAIARLERELAPHLASPNPVGAFYFWNRTRREIALVPYGLLGSVPTVFAPYLDHDLYDFLAGLPAAMLLDHAFHSDAIARAYPAYAHLPFENKTPETLSVLHSHASFGRAVAWRLLSRPSSRLIRKRFALPRALGSLVSHSFSASTHWYSPLALYLDQLDAATRIHRLSRSRNGPLSPASRR